MKRRTEKRRNKHAEFPLLFKILEYSAALHMQGGFFVWKTGRRLMDISGKTRHNRKEMKL